MDVADFDFDLPDELIAQEPPAERGGSRLLVLRRDREGLTHTVFSRLVEYLDSGDLLVVNNTQVFPARLLGRRVPSGGAVECLLLRQLPTPQLPTPTIGALGVGALGVGSFHVWDALMHPGQKLKPGAHVLFEGEGVRLHGEVLARHFHGRRTIRLWTEEGVDVVAAIDRIGHVPLPPYIKRDDRPADRERYQTVYARERGSVAAPTAGLHFTRDVLGALAARGVERAELTLHVGYGTFKPVRAAHVEDHAVDPEWFTVTEAAAAALTRARREGRRIVVVGTSTARALESLQVGPDGRVDPVEGETRLFIYPGHTFRMVDALVTNFHLPRSSLLMLAAAFAGCERLLGAYREAIAGGYRFYSYGDAMVIF
ncbi:MAG: tRNA preQ1(34) S-adenosylmethionine ribosyltransferase-isomerase QueA [Acidobacteria bacterium]|nr:tRNA preQ1(34) S-adenosylmethionine ribosyltransferase-isomerase QueA [Acidobacteriota bacterium]